MSDNIHKVFFKYSTDNKMTRMHFHKMMEKLAKHIPPLFNTTFDTVSALFSLLDRQGVDHISFETFQDWWNTSSRFELLGGTNAKNIRKAHKLFNTHKEKIIGIDGTVRYALRCENFSQLCKTIKSVTDSNNLQDSLDEKEFDIIDTNEDGLVGFYELCKWLKWFHV